MRYLLGIIVLALSLVQIAPQEISDLRDTTIIGASANLGSGFALGSGDLNSDGIQDLVIGLHHGGINAAGEAYIKFGPIDSGIFDLADPATWDVHIIHDRADERLGSGVAVGDINGDGIADLVLGAPTASFSGKTFVGRVYAYLGPLSAGTYTRNQAAIQIDGTDSDDRAGIGLTVVDVDADGYKDLVIGARRGDPNGITNAGEASVIFGPLFAGTYSLESLSGAIFAGILAGDEAGCDVEAGDINGDGNKDLIFVAPFADPLGRTDAGQVFAVILPISRPMINPISLSIADVVFNGAIAGDTPCAIVSGNIMGDSYEDLVIGALSADVNLPFRQDAGRIYAAQGPFAAGIYDMLTVMDRVYKGINAGDTAGRSIAVGDFNNDGIMDLAIGAELADPNGRNNAGETYILYNGL